MPYEVGNKTDQLTHVRRLIQSGQLDELVENMHRLTLVTPEEVTLLLHREGHDDFVQQHADRLATRPLVIHTGDGVFTSNAGAPESPDVITRLPTERFDG